MNGLIAALKRPNTAKLVVLGLLVTAPILFDRFFLSAILSRSLILGLVAATVVFLYRYMGVLSLAQIGIFAFAGFSYGNFVSVGDTNGLNLGWTPWLAVIVAIAAASLVALLLGVLASRSSGIYFMMTTLVFSVIITYFFGQVAPLSGFGGISGIDAHLPWPLGLPAENPFPLYFAILIICGITWWIYTKVVVTPFGLTIQGVRDDPIRMSSLGFNVSLHRALTFAFCGVTAACAGILYVWWNGHIDPTTSGLSASLDLIVIAVVGGLRHISGAWIGAFFFVGLDNIVRNIAPISERFHTVVGLAFLAIVIASPDGMVGLWNKLAPRLRRRTFTPQPIETAPDETGSTSLVSTRRHQSKGQ
jgi:branched-chain amino acid transport system permease protein